MTKVNIKGISHTCQRGGSAMVADQSRGFLCLLCSLLLLLLQPSLEVGEEKACSEEDGECAEHRGRVLELDDSNFSATVEGSQLAVVAFHAPW